MRRRRRHRKRRPPGVPQASKIAIVDARETPRKDGKLMSKPRTLFDKIWDSHVVDKQDEETFLIYIDRHLVHEVTSPQAFEGLRLSGRRVRRPEAALAVADHNIPTTDRSHGIADPESRVQLDALDRNMREYGGAKAYFPFRDARQG